ncbi:unnamed protein product [Medioppia subpectinata]|uniref:Uncharacterized protein n=1 Tax=Medioppia subpectinata TaxID=1979941 RepID=A0A7R9KGE3_9ACAR|nr:unnamed protein product [Medioppia subpectinata]CAG2103063.1 unnamed protein product [Medioppia subpectinata]
MKTIECENNDYFSINQTIDCNSCKISDKMLNNCHIITKSDDYFHCFWPKCQYKTTKKRNLTLHQLSHSEIRQFKCDFNKCNKSYKQKIDLVRHHNSIHLNMRFICDFNECNKKFAYKSDLFRHKSCVHLNKKKFKCNEENCVKKFKQLSHLLRHKRIHSGEKPFWQLVWSDEFDGQYLNKTLWKVEDEWNRGQCERAKELNLLNCYADQRRNLQIINGTLVITPAREWSTYSQKAFKAYTSAIITSRANWTYGRFEVRASLPQGKMLRPAIYMESVNGSLPWATNGFIELVTNRQELLTVGNHQEQLIVGGAYYNETNTTVRYSANNWKYPIGGNGTRSLADFHTYTLEWTPSWMRWYFDRQNRGINFNIGGRLSARYERPGQPFDRPFRLCSAIIVDYVRVYRWVPPEGSDHTLATLLPEESHVNNVTDSTPQSVESHVNNITESTSQSGESYVNNVTVIKALPADRLYSGEICEAAMAYVLKTETRAPVTGALTYVYLIAILRLKAKIKAERNGDDNCGDGKLTEITLNDNTVNYCANVSDDTGVGNERNRGSKGHGNLTRHINNGHLNVRFICDFKSDDYFFCFWPKCQYKTLRKDCLTQHQLIHSEIKQFKCDFNNCNKSFKTLSNLNQHKNVIHLNVRFICDFNECHKSFTTKEDLFRHKSCVHLNEKTFKCNEEKCDKKFGYKSHLIRHKRIHSGEKPFVCHFNNCNKSFGRNDKLKVHMKSHINIKT